MPIDRPDLWRKVSAWLVLAVLFALILGPVIWFAWRQMAHRPAAIAPTTPSATPAPAWLTDTDCRAPLKPGETLQVVFRHEGGHITFRCQSLTDWRALRQLTDKGAPQ